MMINTDTGKCIQSNLLIIYAVTEWKSK